MTTHMTKIWFDGKNIITQEIPETEIYKPSMTKDEALKLALETAEMIAQSDWRKWEELASPEEFERWVKSRAFHLATASKEALYAPPLPVPPLPVQPVQGPTLHEQLTKALDDREKAEADRRKAEADRRIANAYIDKAIAEWRKADAKVARIQGLIKEQK